MLFLCLKFSFRDKIKMQGGNIMCTALTYESNDFYFGRNLDLDITYGEKVTVMPRNFSFPMKCMPDLNEHYTLIGMAVTVNGCPLFFEATNEKGLSMAGLNFPDNAFYSEAVEGKINLAPYELIPWFLGKCSCLSEARKTAEQLNVTDLPFSDDMPLSPLHWIISDKSGALTLESTKEGLKIYENPWGVLANNPPFDRQILNLRNGDSMPGDFSSETRFIRGVFLKEKSSPKKSEDESVSQFFRMLSLVSVPEGCVTKEGKAHFTWYSSCCNADKGIYYYNRCDSYRINKVNMWDFNPNSEELYIPEII